MKKITAALLVFSLAFFVLSVQPSFAADGSSSNPFQNFLQKIQSSISNTTQRLYLMLPGSKPGDMIMNQAVHASAQLQSEKMAADFTVDVQGNDQSLANVKLHADGPIKMNQITDPESYRQDLHVTGAFTMQGTTMQADANIKMAGERVYIQLNEVPIVPFVNLADLKGHWLSTTGAKAPASETATWTDAQKQALQQANTDLLKKATFSSAQKATKDDHAVYVFDVTLPKQAVIEYLVALQEMKKQGTSASNDALMEDASISRDSIAKSLNDVSELKVTLWVDQKSFFIRHVELPLVYTKPSDMSVAPTGGSPLAGLAAFQTAKVSLIMSFDQFNEPVNFEEPTDAEDLQQAVQKLMGLSMPVSPMGTTGKPTIPTPEQIKMPAGINPSELPTLTPQQKLQLEQYSKINSQMGY